MTTTTTKHATDINLPQGMTRKARSCLAWCILLADERQQVPGGIAALAEVLDCWKSEVHEALLELEALGMVRRFGNTSAVKLYVVDLVGLSRQAGLCGNCGCPTAGAGRWCVRCKQRVGRADRAWQTRAIVMLVMGKSPPEIGIAVNRPLWRNRDGDGVDDDGGAVVPYLLREGLLGPEWAAWLKNARTDDEDADDVITRREARRTVGADLTPARHDPKRGTT